MNPAFARFSMVFAAMMAMASPSALSANPTPNTAPIVSKGEPYVMPRSEVRRMRSDAGSDYLIYIAWPQEPPPPEGYPILYLLDGTESFAIAAEYENRLGSYVGLAPGIVVGVGYPDASRRNLDYSPALPPGIGIVPKEARTEIAVTSPIGGADAFLDFLANKVIPDVEAGHQVNPNRRALAGYSLGGLFTLQTLFKRPDLFRTYVASSPSIWYGEKQVLKLLPGLSDRLAKTPSPRRLFLSAGEYEQSPAPGMENDPSWLKIADLSAHAKMIDNARDLANDLKSMPMHVEFRVAPGETHASGDWPALRDAMQRAFADKP